MPFNNIEGSTALLHRLGGDRYAKALSAQCCTYRGWRVSVPASGSVVFGREKVDGEDLEDDITEGERCKVPLDGSAVEGHFTSYTLGYIVFQVFTVDFFAAEHHRAASWNTDPPASIRAALRRQCLSVPV